MSRKFHRLFVIALGFIATLGTHELHGQSLSWNAGTSFSPSMNPNGAWRYGSKSSPSSTLCLYTANTCGWNLPTVGACSSPTCWPYVVNAASSMLQVHPKTSATVGYSVVRWTAPFSGTFQVTGQFVAQAGEPALSCNVSLVSNGVVVPGLSGNVTPTTAFPFLTTLSVQAGSTIDFMVGDGGNGDFQDHCLLGATITALCRLEFTCPTGAGSVAVTNSGCTPSGVYVTAITTTAGAYPNGSFFGVDILFSDLLTYPSLGPPFFGSLDSNGGSVFSIPAGIPSGITIYAVTVDVNMVLLVPISVSPPVTFTTC